MGEMAAGLANTGTFPKCSQYFLLRMDKCGLEFAFLELGKTPSVPLWQILFAIEDHLPGTNEIPSTILC